MPEQLYATPLMSTSIGLRWGAATDNRRVKLYNNLRDHPLHTYPGKPGKGRGRTDHGTDQPAEDPPAADPPAEDPPAEDPLAEDPPDRNSSGGPPAGWNLVFSEDFDGSGDIDTTSDARNWRFESLADPLHRAGNSGMDEYGNTNVAEWQSAKGKRWSAWYDKHHDDNAYRSNGNLVMQGLYSGEPDPTRPHDYYDNGLLTQYGSSKLYTAWLDTFSRIWSEEQMQHVADPSAPNRIFRYGYFEIRVNFSAMNTPGFRLSWWLMPASQNADGTDLRVSNAYDVDGNNGIEIDIFEYEYAGESLENHIVLAMHGGAAGSDSSLVDASEHGLDLRKGYHTIGLLWQPHRLVWNIDGEVVKEFFDTSLIPDVYSYMILSREMNSGVKRSGIDSIDAYDVIEELPYRPRDPGLFAQNVWEFRHRLANDRALIDYVRIWQEP